MLQMIPKVKVWNIVPGEEQATRPIVKATFLRRCLSNIFTDVLEATADHLLPDEAIAYRRGRHDVIYRAVIDAAQYVTHGGQFWTKLDIRNFFGSVPWSGVRKALEDLGYPEEFIAKLMVLVQTSIVERRFGIWWTVANEAGAQAGRRASLRPRCVRQRPSRCDPRCVRRSSSDRHLMGGDHRDAIVSDGFSHCGQDFVAAGDRMHRRFVEDEHRSFEKDSRGGPDPLRFAARELARGARGRDGTRGGSCRRSPLRAARIRPACSRRLRRAHGTHRVLRVECDVAAPASRSEHRSSSAVLPAPFGPATATICPRRARNDARSGTRRLPRRTVSDSTSSTAAVSQNTDARRCPIARREDPRASVRNRVPIAADHAVQTSFDELETTEL